MTTVTVTAPGIIENGPGVLTRIAIPFDPATLQYPQVSSKELIRICDATKTLYASTNDDAQLLGQQYPFGFMQGSQGSQVKTELILSTISMPFYTGLTVLSLPENAIITLTYEVNAPTPRKLPADKRRADNRRAGILAAMRRIDERAMRIACKLPIESEPSYSRVHNALWNMQLKAWKRAAKHTTYHFIPAICPHLLMDRFRLPSLSSVSRWRNIFIQ